MSHSAAAFKIGSHAGFRCKAARTSVTHRTSNLFVFEASSRSERRITPFPPFSLSNSERFDNHGNCNEALHARREESYRGVV